MTRHPTDPLTAEQVAQDLADALARLNTPDREHHPRTAMSASSARMKGALSP